MQIAEWNNELGQMVVRDMTDEEIAARKAEISSPAESDYVTAILGMLDAKAKERRYFGIMSACTYVNSTNPTFKAEAEALLAWRDDVWVTAYATFDQVTAGTIPQPTIPELLAMLPPMIWPS